MSATNKQLAAGDFATELALTRRLLERVPEEHFGWKPHPRSWSLGELAMHIATIPMWTGAILRQDAFDLATLPRDRNRAPESAQALLDTFDRNAEAARGVFDALDADGLTGAWTLRRGDHVLNETTRGAALRQMGLSHLIHHRGQLTVYLRLLDVPVPGLYGPSADE